MLCALNSFPNDKILAKAKLKAFSHDKSNVAKMIISVSDREENIVEKEESACYQHFSFFPHFLKPSVVGPWKPGIVWERVNVVWYFDCVDLPATWFSENKASYLGTIPNYPCGLFPSPFNTQSQLLRNFENIFENMKMLVSSIFFFSHSIFYSMKDVMLSIQFFFFFLLRKWRRLSASSPQQIFPKKSIFPQAIEFSPRNQFSLRWYKGLLRDLVNRPNPIPKDRLQSWLGCM